MSAVWSGGLRMKMRERERKRRAARGGGFGGFVDGDDRAGVVGGEAGELFAMGAGEAGAEAEPQKAGIVIDAGARAAEDFGEAVH